MTLLDFFYFFGFISMILPQLYVLYRFQCPEFALFIATKKTNALLQSIYFYLTPTPQ